MAGNEVTLTIAGDASSATRALEDAGQSAERLESQIEGVGQAARTMGSQIGSSEEAFEGLARESGQLGENLDRASGATSMLSGGLGDVGGALAEIGGEGSALAGIGEQMEKYSAIVTGLTGVLDLANLAQMTFNATTLKSVAAQAAAKVATIASSVASGIATAAQWLWNIAQLASPTTWIILGIVALVAVIVLIATKTTWFQTIWEAVWSGITWYFTTIVNVWKTVFTTVWDAIVAYFTFVVGFYRKAWETIKAAGSAVMDWFKSIPGMLSSAFSNIFNIITAPFRRAFNFVADAWNNTVGRLRWTVPSWVPVVGGNTLAAPTIPKFHAGGVVPGVPGQEVLALLQAGEVVNSRAGGGGSTVIEIRSGGSRIDDALVELLAGALRRNGGLDVVLGGRSG